MKPEALLPNTTLCPAPYSFSYCEIEDSTLELTGLGTFSLYCYEGTLAIFDPGEGRHRAIFTGDIVHYAGLLRITGKAKFFLIRDPVGSLVLNWMDIQRAGNAYTVKKPWGEEIWLTGPARRDYCMKRIRIRAGHQTSLQYHREKIETNVLMEGHIELIGESPYNELVSAPAYVNVLPPTVHRIRALSDIVLVEASTAHLDDVVRLQDDANRPSGRIDDEHKQ